MSVRAACTPSTVFTKRPTTKNFRTLRSATTVVCNVGESRTTRLRQLIHEPGILLGPCCHDGLSAKLIERAGFSFSFMSGFCTSAARLGAPDTGLISYAEMVDQGRNVVEATDMLPIIADGDTGYGNALNVKRTVQGYASAGLSGVLIEDQVWPKSCGHVQDKRVVDRKEAVSRITAASNARDQGRDIVIVARTDARQALNLNEALWRVSAFLDAGADIVFIDALETVEEMQRFCQAAPSAAKMANMLEGGGKTPLLTPQQLEEMGFKLCAYPLSLLGVSVRAMEIALEGLKHGRIPQPPTMPTFDELKEAVGFPEYYAEEAKYASIVLPSAPLNDPETGCGDQVGGEGTTEVSSAAETTSAIEADEVVEPGVTRESGVDQDSASKTIDLYSLGSSEGQYGTGDAARKPQWLRVSITDMKSGMVKLNARFPAGFLDSVASFVPQVAGMDLEALLKQSKGQGWDPSKPVLEFGDKDDMVQLYLEFK